MLTPFLKARLERLDGVDAGELALLRDRVAELTDGQRAAYLTTLGRMTDDGLRAEVRLVAERYGFVRSVLGVPTDG